MKVYIASSWKNQHAVEMLTQMLRDIGCEVISWVENNYGEIHNHVTKKFDFEAWVKSPESQQSFDFDTNGAMTCDLFIYVGPAGKDAAAECGMAYAKGIPMLALYAKGEDFGLMRKMFLMWFVRYNDMLKYVKHLVLESSEEGVLKRSSRGNVYVDQSESHDGPGSGEHKGGDDAD